MNENFTGSNRTMWTLSDTVDTPGGDMAARASVHLLLHLSTGETFSTYELIIGHTKCVLRILFTV